MEAQFYELGSRIGKLKKSKIDEMDDFLRRREILAEQLRERDPSRFATKEMNRKFKKQKITLKISL